MLLLSKIFTLIFLLILSPSVLSTEGKEGCLNCSQPDIEYLIENHEKLYKDNYEVYWKSLNRLRNNAFATDSPNEIYQFLQIFKLENYPVEVEEFLSESLETLCVDKSILLKKVMQQLNPQLSAKLNKKLKHPLFREEKELEKCRDCNILPGR